MPPKGRKTRKAAKDPYTDNATKKMWPKGTPVEQIQKGAPRLPLK